MNAERECPHAEQAVGLALHALEPADEDLLAEHVPHCAICQELVRQTQDVVWGLAGGAEQRDPPARLRTDLMAAVTATDQLPPEQREQPWVTEQPAEPSVPAGSDADGSARPATGIPPATAPAAAGWQSRRRLIALVATLVVAVVGVGGVTYQLIERARQQQQTALAAPSPEVGRLLAEADRAGARHALLHALDGKVIAAVVQFPNAQQVMPIQLPANPADHTVYVLWGLGDGPPEAIGTFDVTAPSATMLPIDQPVRTGAYPSYAISIENGRSTPPSPGLVVASGRVQS